VEPVLRPIEQTPLPAPQAVPGFVPVSESRGSHPVLPPQEAASSSTSDSVPVAKPDRSDPPSPKPSRLPLALGIAAIIGIAALAIGLRPTVAAVPVAQPVAVMQHQVVAQPQVQVTPTTVSPVAGAVKDGESGAPAMWGIWIIPGSASIVNRVISGDGINVVAQRVNQTGVVVSAYVRADTQAQAIGLIPGDLIISYNGVPTPDVESLNSVHLANTAGAPSTLTVVRGGTLIQLNGPVGAAPAQGALK